MAKFTVDCRTAMAVKLTLIGKPVGNKLTKTVADITERKSAEQTLHRQKCDSGAGGNTNGLTNMTRTEATRCE